MVKEILCGDAVDTMICCAVSTSFQSQSLKISCKEIEEQPASLPDGVDVNLAFLPHKMYN